MRPDMLRRPTLIRGCLALRYSGPWRHERATTSCRSIGPWWWRHPPAQQHPLVQRKTLTPRTTRWRKPERASPPPSAPAPAGPRHRATHCPPTALPMSPMMRSHRRAYCQPPNHRHDGPARARPGPTRPNPSPTSPSPPKDCHRRGRCQLLPTPPPHPTSGRWHPATHTVGGDAGRTGGLTPFYWSTCVRVLQPMVCG